MLVTAGQRHAAVVFEALMEQGAVKRPGRGRPRLRPKRVVADKGYSSGKIRRYLRRRGIRMTIPRNRMNGGRDRLTVRSTDSGIGSSASSIGSSSSAGLRPAMRSGQ